MDVKKVEDGARQVYEGLIVIAQQIPNLKIRRDIEHQIGICSYSLATHNPTIYHSAEDDPEYKEIQDRIAKIASEYRDRLREVV